MNPILIDTNAYVAFKRGQTRAIEIFQHAPAIAVNTVVLGELLAGFAVGTHEKANRKGHVRQAKVSNSYWAKR